ncbi:DUF3748 domain-containing protein [Empedobacter sedimenti]|uniref:DUF3748 domain-containing protein n=1 Tax=Empedobacter sedimenti TaxID=3042610 RepID=UPI0024A661C3|nr:DUF3748 domain-containing protein [Empedobacter sedimenti]
MKNLFNIPTQLTFKDHGHTLHHDQIESFDENLLVFDTRNDDTKIGETQFIKIIDLNTLEIFTLYSTDNQSKFGPGVGAATFSPKENNVIFIHGIRNSDENKPYSATRRTGVSVKLDYPNQAVFMDARNIYSPFTAGALRGGTHSHSWHENGKWISFTYNDYILEEESKKNPLIKDQRVVGMMFPKDVEVPLDNDFENNNGKMFSIIVSKVVNHAKNGSDEIEKAFDECWINGTNNIAFQGHVRDENGKLQTDIFVVSIPVQINFDKNDNLKGTNTTLPEVPQCISQKRITFTENGISNLRHWLRSSPCGNIIYFLMEDLNKVTQIFGVEINSTNITQYTFLENNINSPFNISKDGKYAVFFSDDKIFVSDLSNKISKIIYDSLNNNNKLTGIPHFSLNGKKIYFNQFVQHQNNEFYIQIFFLENTIRN